MQAAFLLDLASLGGKMSFSPLMADFTMLINRFAAYAPVSATLMLMGLVAFADGQDQGNTQRKKETGDERNTASQPAVGRAASCNKPSARNGGVNLQQEVEPHLTGKTSSRLAQRPPGPGYGPRSKTEHTT